MNWLSTILSWLPLNGSKTKLGAWVTGITALYAILQQIDPTLLDSLAALLTTKPINWAGVGLVLVGLLHKWLKVKYPEAEKKAWPE